MALIQRRCLSKTFYLFQISASLLLRGASEYSCCLVQRSFRGGANSWVVSRNYKELTDVCEPRMAIRS